MSYNLNLYILFWRMYSYMFVFTLFHILINRSISAGAACQLILKRLLALQCMNIQIWLCCTDGTSKWLILFCWYYCCLGANYCSQFNSILLFNDIVLNAWNKNIWLENNGVNHLISLLFQNIHLIVYTLLNNFHQNRIKMNYINLSFRV